MAKSNKVQDNEPITRYVFQSNHHTTSKIKWQAFQPRNGEVSVFRVEKLSNEEIWSIGRDYVGKLREKTPCCRGDFLASIAREIGLDITPETKNHEKHANIVKWPDKESEQILLAKKLVDKIGESGFKKYPETAD